MRVRIAVTLLAAALVVLAAGAPAGYAKHGRQDLENLMMKEHVLLLAGYVDGWAGDHDGLYPPAEEVHVGGGLPAPVWPRNPWTLALLHPGTDAGDYEYTVAGDRRSYSLAGHLSAGRLFVVDGAGPATPPLAAACDAAVKSGTSLIERFMMDFASAQGDLPTPTDLDPESSFGKAQGDWPLSPFDGLPMQPGTEPGQYTYTPGADGSYSLVGHLSSGDFSRSGPAYDWSAYKDELTIQGAMAICQGIEMYAFDHNGTYPTPWEVAPGGEVGLFVDPWPRNPWVVAPMQEGSSRGTFTYSVSPSYDAYTMVANLAGGETYDVAQWVRPFWERFMRVRVSLKNMCTQAYGQVLKDYVDKWALTHDGTLPTEDEMTPTGAVGQAQTWWPVSPWDLAPMAPGSGTGEYEYTPGAGGAFTLLVHQVPLDDYPGAPGSGYPPTYTAQ